MAAALEPSSQPESPTVEKKKPRLDTTVSESEKRVLLESGEDAMATSTIVAVANVANANVGKASSDEDDSIELILSDDQLERASQTSTTKVKILRRSESNLMMLDEPKQKEEEDDDDDDDDDFEDVIVADDLRSGSGAEPQSLPPPPLPMKKAPSPPRPSRPAAPPSAAPRTSSKRSKSVEEDMDIDTTVSHAREKAHVLSRCRGQHDMWCSVMGQGFSVLLWGVGSKIEVLDEFVHQYLSKRGHVVVVRGFSNMSTGQELCRGLVDNLARCLGATLTTSSTAKPQEKWRALATYLSENRLVESDSEGGDDEDDEDDDNDDDVDWGTLGPARLAVQQEKERGTHWRGKRVSVVIHSIDGMALRSAEWQSLLGDIASTHEVQMVASVDDIHAHNMWSKELLEQFRWWWVPVHTFKTYEKETAVKATATSGKKEIRTADSTKERILLVLRSLTQLARQCFASLCEHQISLLQVAQRRQHVWTTLKQWRKMDGMEVVKDQSFTSWLEQFVSHDIVELTADKRSCRITHLDLEGLKDLLTKIQAVKDK